MLPEGSEKLQGRPESVTEVNLGLNRVPGSGGALRQLVGVRSGICPGPSRGWGAIRRAEALMPDRPSDTLKMGFHLGARAENLGRFRDWFSRPRDCIVCPNL